MSRIGDKVILEPMEKPPFDVKAWREKLDAMGAEDFLPDDPPLLPDDTSGFVFPDFDADNAREAGEIRAYLEGSGAPARRSLGDAQSSRVRPRAGPHRDGLAASVV